jgi:hypothetical protein
MQSSRSRRRYEVVCARRRYPCPAWIVNGNSGPILHPTPGTSVVASEVNRYSRYYAAQSIRPHRPSVKPVLDFPGPPPTMPVMRILLLDQRRHG